MEDPRIKIIDSIDLKGTQVLKVPGFVFLCGGQQPDGNNRPLFARSHFHNWLQENDPEMTQRIILAEKVNDWSEDGVYRELFTLEKHLAALANVIVLFAESPGSIAELGAFSALPEVKEKLLVFVQTKNYEKRSFIKLGPIKLLQPEENKQVRIYPWEVDDNNFVVGSSLTSHLPFIYKDVSASDKGRLNKKFESEKHREQMLLIHALVFLMLGLLQTEIKTYLDTLDVKINRETLKQYLFVLEKLSLIKKVPYGGNEYYVANNSSKFLQIRRKDESVLNTERAQNSVMEYYKNEDHYKSRALSEIIAAPEGKEPDNGHE